MMGSPLQVSDPFLQKAAREVSDAVGAGYTVAGRCDAR